MSAPSSKEQAEALLGWAVGLWHELKVSPADRELFLRSHGLPATPPASVRRVDVHVDPRGKAARPQSAAEIKAGLRRKPDLGTKAIRSAGYGQPPFPKRPKSAPARGRRTPGRATKLPAAGAVFRAPRG